MFLPLYDVLNEDAEDWFALYEALGVDSPDTLIVVPDARLPRDTVRDVLYTAMNARPFGSHALAGEHQCRLWSATATKPDPTVPCALSA